MLTYLKIGGVALILFAAGFGGWTLASWDYGAKLAKAQAQYAENMTKVSDAAAKANADNLTRLQAAQAQIAQQDAKYSKDMSDASDQIAAAQVQLAAHPDSFSVLANCPGTDTGGGDKLPGPTTAPSMDHGPTQVRAIVDPGIVKRLLAATARGDKALIQLAALQAYVLTITKGAK